MADIQPCGEVRHIPEWNLVSVVQDESTPDVDRPPKLEAHSGEHRCADFLRAPDVDRPPKLEAHSGEHCCADFLRGADK